MDEINANLEQITNKMEQLEGVHRRRLMAFDDAEQQMHEREIDILTKDITNKFKKSERSLKRILATNSKPGNTDERVRRNIQRSLATRRTNRRRQRQMSSENKCWNSRKAVQQKTN